MASAPFDIVKEVLARAAAAEKGPDTVGPLSRYFGLHGHDPYTGSRFETIGGYWNQPEYLNVITAGDLVALATLSVSVTGRAATEILSDSFQREASRFLCQIDRDACIIDDNALQLILEDTSVGAELWKLFRPGATSGAKNVDNFGQVRTSKLLARKRPGLFPIYDSVVAQVLGLRGSLNHWTLMHDLMTAHGADLWNRADQLRSDVGIGAHVTPLRVVDIVLWMHGKSAGFEGDADN